MTDQKHFLISGAGIGGLTAALALLQRGFDVDIYEQAPELGDIGAGIQIGPNGSRLLIGLGLEDALQPALCEAALKIVRIWKTGQTWKLFDLGKDSIDRFGAPYWFVHRGDLHRVLLDAVTAIKPDAVHVDARCTGFTQDGDTVRLHMDGKDDATGDILIGADGVHSQIRHALPGPTPAEFMGIIAWRGLAPMEKLPAELQEPLGTNWVGPGGHIVTYPLRGGKFLNFAGFGERDDWKVESWTEPGTKDECAADFEGWNALVHAIIDAIDIPYKWALVGRPPLQGWTKGRTTLLGDAAHAMLPFLAQGAIMALEDAVVLARCAEKYDDAEEMLRRYEALRLERTTEVVEGSAANAKRFHNPALLDMDEAVAYVDQQWQPDQIRLRYDWLFDYDAAKVAI